MDLVTLIVDLLRKKEEDAALNAGGPVASGNTPTPEMLGSGGAQKAAEALLKRKSQPMEYVDSL